MPDLNPLHYHLSELRKALIALIPLAFVLVSYALHWVPPIGFETALIGLVGPLFAAIAVFGAKNHSPDDIAKALKVLTGAAIMVATYWVKVPASLDNKIALGIVFIATFFGVHQVKNEPPAQP